MTDGENGILLVIETSDGAIRATSLELFGAGRGLADEAGGPLVGVLIGHDLGPAVDQAARLGADRVLVADAPGLAQYTTDGYARAVEAAIEIVHPAAVLLAGTTSGRDVAPFLAAKRGAAHLVDCMRVSRAGGAFTGVRPVYQGKLLSEVRVSGGTSPVFVTVHAGAFAPPEPRAERPAEISPLEVGFALADIRVEVAGMVQAPAGPTNLEAAAVVVVGGRGLGEAANFSYVEELAAVLDGAVGATRAVTDLGWRPHYEQVGQTGKTVAPSLYIGLGVSGAVQHTVGMRGSETIVAINRDPDAPIFKLADFGIVGDVFEIAPKLTQRLRELRGK